MKQELFPAHLRGNIQSEVSLARRTTLGVGGKGLYYCEPSDEAQLEDLLVFLQNAGVACKVLGAGSNVVIPDKGYEGCVIRLGRDFRYAKELQPGMIEVGASMPLMTLARTMANAGYSGLEFAGGIPASLGGAICMNAGAHGGEMSSLVEMVHVVSPDGSAWLAKRSWTSPTAILSCRKGEW